MNYRNRVFNTPPIPVGLSLILAITVQSQAYIKKGRTPIQVFPVPNAYTTSKVVATTCTVRIRDRKYLNRCMPLFDGSLCND